MANIHVKNMVFSNTQYLKIENWKLIGYESGIEKYLGFGLGIGLPGTCWVPIGIA